VLKSIPSYPRPVIERLVARLIDHLDEQDGDPELEGDPFNEGEPAFDAQSRALVGRYPYQDPDHDAEPSAWLERTDQEQPAYPQGAAHFQTNEDAEDDDPAEDEHDAEPDDIGSCVEYRSDQRVAFNYSARPWDIDADRQL
jgi:hypothetical protein